MPAFTNDDLKTLGAFDQAQGSTNDQLRLLRSVANRIGLYDAADALARIILDEALPAATAPDAEKATPDADTFFAEVKAMVDESLTRVVILDNDMSDRFADTVMAIEDREEAIAFSRRVMIDLRVLPAQTAKIGEMTQVLSTFILEAL